jgi:hypothetical protein
MHQASGDLTFLKSTVLFDMLRPPFLSRCGSQALVARCASGSKGSFVTRCRLCLWAPLVAVLATSSLRADDGSTPQADFSRKIQPLLQKYCYECHGEKAPQAGVDLTRYKSPRQVFEGRRQWTIVLEKIRAGEMPPEDAKATPSETEREELAAWVASALSRVDCRNRSQPGQVTLRRLTRYEYRNSVRDLTGIDYQPASDFPGDDTGYGFDNIGDVLSLPPILLEKYLAAAEQIAAKAIVAVEPGQTVDRRITGAAMKTEGGRTEKTGASAKILLTNATLTESFEAPLAGMYEIRIQAAGDQAGNDPPKMGLLIDGKQEKQFQVRNDREHPNEFSFKQRLREGKHTLGVAFLNDYYNEKAPNPKKRDRNLIVHSVQLTGPLNLTTRNLPDSHKRIITTEPDAKITRRAASEKVVREFAGRAFRRPVTDAEVGRLVALTEQSRADGESFEQGIQLAVQAVLLSPSFLFKPEIDPPGGQGQPRNLTDYEVATRLSYFLWSSAPDAELLAQCASKSLLVDRNRDQQVRRMLKDERTKALVENFVGQWLELRSLERRKPDAVGFPMYNAQLAAAMRRETELFVWTILRDDLTVVELLSGNFTYVNEPLARLYGIKGVTGKEFQLVSTAGTHRGGLLTQASFLTVTSNPNRTSPVKRGRFILDNFLGTPPPPPPPNVPELKETRLEGTLRQRLEEHRTNPICASCHNRMDPLGFALENYDAIGQWREVDGVERIDSSGKLPTGEEFKGPESLRKLLVSRKEEFARCLTEKLLTYALGRGLEYEDQCAVDEIVKKARLADYRFSAIVLEIVRSDLFLKKGSRP